MFASVIRVWIGKPTFKFVSMLILMTNWKGPPNAGGPLFLQGYSLGKIPWRLQTDTCVAVCSRLGDERPTSKYFQRPASIRMHKHMSLYARAFWFWSVQHSKCSARKANDRLVRKPLVAVILSNQICQLPSSGLPPIPAISALFRFPFALPFMPTLNIVQTVARSTINVCNPTVETCFELKSNCLF